MGIFQNHSFFKRNFTLFSDHYNNLPYFHIIIIIYDYAMKKLQFFLNYWSAGKQINRKVLQARKVKDKFMKSAVIHEGKRSLLINVSPNYLFRRFTCTLFVRGTLLSVYTRFRWKCPNTGYLKNKERLIVTLKFTE